MIRTRDLQIQERKVALWEIKPTVYIYNINTVNKRAFKGTSKNIFFSDNDYKIIMFMV